MPGRALVRHEDFGVRQLETLDLDRPVATLVPPLGKRLSNSGKVLAELRPEHPEVRLHCLLYEPFGRIPDLDRFHIELVLDDVGEVRAGVERAPVAVVRIEDDDQLGQRRPRLHSCG